MLESKFGRVIAGVGLLTLSTAALLVGCSGSGTGDGEGNDTSEIGQQYISDGAAGSTIQILIGEGAGEADPAISVAETKGFRVILKDPNGLPLDNVQVFCESEHGIAILEPSKGGVAFEHTNDNGIMSGVIGGLTAGSYMFQCEGPQGYNLETQVHIRVSGEAPQGFTGWEGAAGGNLGGGRIVESTTGEVSLDQVQIITNNSTSASTVAHIDNVQGTCGTTTITAEPFFYDDYTLTITNSSGEAVQLETVSFTVSNGVTSTTQLNGLVIEAGATDTISGPLTDGSASPKAWAGTGSSLSGLDTTLSITFTVTGEGATSGESFSESQSIAVTGGNVDNCS